MDCAQLSPQEMSHLLKELLVGLRSFTNSDGVMKVENVLRLGSPTDMSSTFTTHDFCDKTTWYQQSIEVINEVLTSAERIVFPFSKNPVVDADSPRLYGRDYALPTASGALVDRSHFRLRVSVNENEVLPTDATYGWTMDFMKGELTFKNRVPNDAVVRATYHYVPESGGSRFILRPPPGKRIVVEHVEVQFSETVTINDDICFELWAGVPAGAEYMYKSPEYINSPMNPWRQIYRSAHDFVNNGNEGQGLIPPFGGSGPRGLHAGTLVFPFNYIQAFAVDSRINSEFHVYLAGDKPYTNCEISTCSFYAMITDV